jgi:Zn-dependent membrane protease YugP
MFYLDPFYLMIIIVTLVISFAAQSYVKSTYNRYGRVPNGSGLTGLEIGKALVERTALGDDYEPRITEGGRAPGVQVQAIRFAATPGQLTDHYDPRNHTVYLSEGVGNQPTVAAMAIVAHELGHAEQKERASVLMSLRNLLVPAIRFSPQLAYICIFIGLVFNFIQLFWLGILFYALMVGLILLDLPIEIDASRRATRLLNEAGLLRTEDDAQGTRRMLTAAASTYMAAAVTAILQLLYYISIGRRRS